MKHMDVFVETCSPLCVYLHSSCNEHTTYHSGFLKVNSLSKVWVLTFKLNKFLVNLFMRRGDAIPPPPPPPTAVRQSQTHQNNAPLECTPTYLVAPPRPITPVLPSQLIISPLFHHYPFLKKINMFF